MKKELKGLSGWKKNNKGMGTVEMILIIVVLIGLVLIFKTQIQELAQIIFEKLRRTVLQYWHDEGVSDRVSCLIVVFIDWFYFAIDFWRN